MPVPGWQQARGQIMGTTPWERGPNPLDLLHQVAAERYPGGKIGGMGGFGGPPMGGFGGFRPDIQGLIQSEYAGGPLDFGRPGAGGFGMMDQPWNFGAPWYLTGGIPSWNAGGGGGGRRLPIQYY